MKTTDREKDDVNEANILALSRLLTAWEGDPVSAERVRSLAAQITLPSRQPSNPAEAAVFLALNARTRGADKLAARLGENPEIARMFGPFYGDPAISRWPFHDPAAIEVNQALQWLALLRGASPDERMERFVAVFFLARQRRIWMAASRTAAQLLGRSLRLPVLLADWWAHCFPRGYNGVAPTCQSTIGPGHMKVANLRRHILHLACSVAALGGDTSLFPGFDADQFGSQPLPQDESDASARILALAALAEGKSTRGAVARNLAQRLREAVPGEQTMEALRLLADALGSDPADHAPLAILKSVLVRFGWPTEKDDEQAASRLWGWLETARWFLDAGDRDSVASMREIAGPAANALRVKLACALADEVEPVAMLLGHLKTLGDPDCFHTTPLLTRAVGVVEAMLLFDLPGVSSLPMAGLLNRALGRGAYGELSGSEEGVSFLETTAEVGPECLAVWIARHGLKKGTFVPPFLLRDRLFSRRSIVRLAACQNGFVARQVAIMLEHELRNAKSRMDRISLLWEVRQAKPPADTFRELRAMLRETPALPDSPEFGLQHPLAAVLDTEVELNRKREQWADILPTGRSTESGRPESRTLRAELLAAIANLLERSADYLSPVETAGDAVGFARHFAREVEAIPEWISQLPAWGVGPWLASARRLLGPGGSLDRWSSCVGRPLPGLVEAWSNLEFSLAEVENSTPRVSEALLERTARQMTELELALRPAAWPEETLVSMILEQVDTWRKELRVAARAADQAANAIQVLLENHEEKSLVEYSGNPAKVRGTANGDLRRLHRFLLENLLFRSAFRFRSLVATLGRTVSLQTPFSYLAPLLLGAAGGVFLILDVGMDLSNKLLPASPKAMVPVCQYALTVSLAVSASLLLLVSGLARRRSGRQRNRVFLRACLRVLPLFGLTLLISGALCAIVLWTLGAFDEPHIGKKILLWASLSQFLGLFLGLLLQGRSVVNEVA